MAVTPASSNCCSSALCGTQQNNNQQQWDGDLYHMYAGNPRSQLFVNKMKVTARESNPGRDIFCTCPDWPWGPSRHLRNGYWVSFPGVRQAKHSVEHPPISSMEVKETIALKRYSSSGLSWPVLGWTLPFYESSGDVEGCYSFTNWFFTWAFRCLAHWDWCVFMIR